MGKQEEALKMYEEIEKTLKKANTQPSYAAIGAAQVGKNDRALQIFKMAAESRDPNFAVCLSVLKREQSITKIPGFKEILLNAGVPLHEEWFKYN